MIFLSVADAADRLGVRPRDVSDLFYSRILDTKRCPIVANRRLIPADYLPEIKKALVVRGKISDEEEAVSCA